MITLRIGIAICLAVLAACSDKEPTEQPRLDPVVIYAAFEETAELTDVVSQYTEETGVLVIVRRGAAANIVDDLIENRISPPADVLMTESVVDAWWAAEESALRPLFSDQVRNQVPDWGRDPDDLWFGHNIRFAVIVHTLPDLGADGLSGITALAEQRFAGSLCLSSSTNAINRTVIATMIDDLGVRQTELVVRDWVKNLARPPFDTEAQLLEAIQEGSCRIAIVSNTAIASGEAGQFRRVGASSYMNVATIGVARHARNPDGATAFIEWLFDNNNHINILADIPADRRNVSLLALHYDDAVKLAERARYR